MSANWRDMPHLGDLVVRYADMSSEEYHSNLKLGDSHSSLQLFRQSPARYAAICVTKQVSPDAPSKSMILGDALHSLLLAEQGRPSVVGDESWRSGCCEGLPHCDVSPGARVAGLAKGDDAVLNGIHSAIKDNEHAVAALCGLKGCNERVFSCVDSASGIRVKCRPDRFLANGMVVDLKTTAGSASPEEFSRTVEKYGYHRQAAMYLDVLRTCGEQAGPFLFVVVSKAAPYEVGLFVLDDESIAIGRRENNDALYRLAECRRSFKWQHEWESKVVTIGLPEWRKKRSSVN